MNRLLLLLTVLPALMTSGCHSRKDSADIAAFPFGVPAGAPNSVSEPIKRVTPKQEYKIISFKLVRTFHPPVLVTLEHMDVGGTEPWIWAVYQEYSGKGGYEWGRIQKQSGRKVSPEEWHSVLSDFKALDFMQLSNAHPSGGADGSSWIISGMKSGSSFEFSFYSPVSMPEYSKVVEFGKKMLKLGSPEGEVVPLY